MSNIVPVSVSDIERMAVAVAKSGLFGVRTVEQATALMLISQAEGMHPAIAARDYHVINGRPTLKADAMLARFQQAGGTVKWGKYTDAEVSATIAHPQGGSVEISWTMEMANRAGLTKNPTWRQYPRQMLRARVISEGIRTVFPGVAVGVYTPEEAADFDKKPEPAAPSPAPAEPKDMGPAQIVDAAPLVWDDAEEMLLEAIVSCDTIEDLENLRPAIRKLPDEKRAVAMGQAKAQAAFIRSQTTEEPTDDEEG